MKRFDIYALKNAEPHIPYAIILQANGFEDLGTFITAPLRRKDNYRGIPIINPVVEFEDDSYLIQIERLAGIAAGRLDKKVGEGSAYEYEISRALDRLLFNI